MYKYLFGPIPSRRLGMSLGVDLVPKKVCSLDCVYCEVGSTTNLTCARKEYLQVAPILAELDDYFENSPDPDFFTFSGYGEPTLNSGMEMVLRYIKSKRPNVPIAVLTNGTLLSNPDVRKALFYADVVLPSLDSALDESFRKINRPNSDISMKDYIQGLEDFRAEFIGKIWLEILILPGYNDSMEDLNALKEAILRIHPDSVQLNTLDRPGTIPGLRPASRMELQSIINYWGFDNVSIIASSAQRKENKSYRADTESAIVQTIARRPCTIDDMSQMLGLHVNEINKYLDTLDADGKLEIVREERGVFYQLKSKLQK